MDVQYAAALQDQLIEFFLNHYHFPHSIWELIDQYFDSASKEMI